MDCVDCHNRATHIYAEPEVALNAALNEGRISRELPYAKKVGMGALLGSYADQASAMQVIDHEVRGVYLPETGVDG